MLYFGWSVGYSVIQTWFCLFDPSSVLLCGNWMFWTVTCGLREAVSVWLIWLWCSTDVTTALWEDKRIKATSREHYESVTVKEHSTVIQVFFVERWEIVLQKYKSWRVCSLCWSYRFEDTMAMLRLEIIFSSIVIVLGIFSLLGVSILHLKWDLMSHKWLVLRIIWLFNAAELWAMKGIRWLHCQEDFTSYLLLCWAQFT